MRLVLLPGLDGTGELYSWLEAALDREYSTSVVSYPYDRHLSYLELADLVIEAILDDCAFVLLGESFSGPVAIEVAARKPAGLKGVILSCSFARNPMPLLRLSGLVSGLMSPKYCPRLLLKYGLLGNWSTIELLEAIKEAVSRVSAGVLRSRVAEVGLADFSAQLRLVDYPMMYLQAGADRLVPAREAAFIQSINPDIKIVRIDGPHALLQACAEPSAYAIREFIESIVEV